MTQEKPQTPRAARQVEDLPVRAGPVSGGAKVHVEQTRDVGRAETRKDIEEEDTTMEAKRRSQWLKGIVAFGLGLTLLALEAGGASAGPRTKGTAAPDACDIN